MTVKTTLSFTDRHHAYLARVVEEGVFATQSAAVASAVEAMMREDEERDLALQALAVTVRERMKTPLSEYVPAEDVFARLKAKLRSRIDE
jgi:antitoxin ParD1/3/4